MVTKVISQKEVLSELTIEDLDKWEIVRTNKRGKTATICFDKNVEILIKFPGAKELNGFVEMLNKTKLN